jgi:hypothetical protein
MFEGFEMFEGFDRFDRFEMFGMFEGLKSPKGFNVNNPRCNRGKMN